MTCDHALFVGDVSWDTTVRVDHLPGADEKVLTTQLVEDAGGVTSNAASACVRAGVRARLIAAAAPDRAGESAVSALSRRGVWLEADTATGTTCRALVMLTEDGEKRLILVPGDTMYPDSAAVATADLAGVRWAHTAVYDTHVARILATRCRAAEIPFSVDLEPATLAGGLDALEPCLAGAHTVFVNSHTRRLLGDPVPRLARLGVVEVVETLGGQGARLTRQDRSCDQPAPALQAPVVDTTGAGDCLAGTYIAARLQRRDPEAALRLAVQAASLSCTRIGGPGSYAAIGEVDALGATRLTSPHHHSTQEEPFQ